ncbi:MAG: hypothetical protein LUQ14_01840 [Methanomassiliicoccales archaeon]|nr:hypothetical protein [Methanomassiliicoccales archaeon]
MEFEGLEELAGQSARQFVTDGEGPITKNDNAYELSCKLIENGDMFFALVSKYDDVLADVFHKRGYKAGDTLKLILPFLKAHGATNRKMIDLSKANILLVPGAERTMRFVHEFMQSFIVSTSYEHYVSAVCEAIGFPLENVYCTKVNMDETKMEEWEQLVLKNYEKEIALMPMIEIPEGARGVEDFDPRDQRTIRRLDEIFWHDMTDLPSYQLILEVNPVGGEEKAASIVDICRKTGASLEDTIYVGDSITDVQAFRLVKDGGGLAVSFNGNSYAVREADLAVMSSDTVTTSVLAETFYKGGKDSVMELIENWNMEHIKKTGIVHEYLVKELARVFPEQLPVVAKVSADNMPQLSQLSSKFRKTVRGEAIGTLG